MEFFSFALGEEPITGSCKHDNVISGSMKWGICSVDEEILPAGVGGDELHGVITSAERNLICYTRTDYIPPI